MKNSHEVQQFGKHLKQLRKDAGFTQSALAFEAGIGERTLQEIEAGSKAVTINLLFSIARALELQPAQIFKDFQIEMED